MVRKIETWKMKDGTTKTFVVVRDSKGHFVKGSKRSEIFVGENRQPILSKIEVPKNEFMFRSSYAINGVPVHRKYLSFLLQAYSLDEEKLNEKRNRLKDLLVKLANKYLGYDYNALSEWNMFSYYIAEETSRKILIHSPDLETWEFIVEKDGAHTYSESGSIDEI